MDDLGGWHGALHWHLKARPLECLQRNGRPATATGAFRRVPFALPRKSPQKEYGTSEKDTAAIHWPSKATWPNQTPFSWFKGFLHVPGELLGVSFKGLHKGLENYTPFL